MNAETGTEPEAPKKRGRIPQSAWPQILERHRSGATLSAIAREFECTPSAISYILRKAEASDEAGGEDAASIETSEAGPTESPEPAAPRAPRGRRAAAPPPVSASGETASAAPAPATPTHAAESRQPSSAAQPAPSHQPAQTETLRLNRPAEPAPVAPPPPPAPVAAAPATAPNGAAATDGQRAAAGGPPPVDAVEARLRETARGCLSAYRGWRQQPGETSIQALSDAVHELRKALARIEIDMSASRREEQAIRPIPIPAHRAARRTP